MAIISVLKTLHNLGFMVYNFNFVVVLPDKLQNCGENLINMTIPHTAYPQRSQLPQVMVIYFSYGHIKLVP